MRLYFCLISNLFSCHYASRTLRIKLLTLNSSKRFNDRAGQYIGRHFFGHKSPAVRARELFKPSTNLASLVVKIEKTIFGFGGGFLEVTSQWGHVLEILALFGRPWAPTCWPILLTQSFVENRVKIRVYRALDWHASKSVAKIMGQKPSFWPNSKLFRKGTICPLRANFGQS